MTYGTRRARWATAGALVLGLIVVVHAPARAQTSLPPEIAAAIEATAKEGRADIARDVQAVAGLQDRLLAAQVVEQARQRAYARLTAAVISAIERYPQLVRPIVDLAIRTAPESRTAVVTAVAGAYPGFAGQLPATGRTAAAPRPSSRPRPPGVAPASGLDWYDQPILRQTLARAARETGGLSPAGRVAPVTGGPGVVPSPAAMVGQGGSGFKVPDYMMPAYTPAGFLAADAPRTATPPGPAQRAGPPLPEAPASASEPQPRRRPPVRRDTVSDPLEPVNRVIFAFNDVVDIALLRPIAALYGFTPEPAKAAVRRVFQNLQEPLTFANDVLQFDAADAGTAVVRFALNSTIGVLGLFDPATAIGLPRHTADFGQTLYSYGVGAGPYLVLPLLGPSTARDTAGRVADYFLDPFGYVLDRDERLALGAADMVVTREKLMAPLDDLRATSVDYYAAVRGAYYQDRAVELAKGRAADTSDAVDRLFDEIE